MESLKISRPFDAHVHLREGDILKTVLPYTANVFFSAVAMGNLTEPISTAEQVRLYREQIFSALPSGSSFTPIMSVMLQKNMTSEILGEAHGAGARVLKFIPAATSTNSSASNGVTIPELRNYYAVLAKAADLGMIFSGHWELARVAGNVEIPELERERLAIPWLREIISDFSELRIMVEHVTTAEMIEVVKAAPDNVAATITAHHLVLEAKDVMDPSGRIINSLNYCKPVAKTHHDRMAVVETAVSGHPRFFFGSDSAPHPISAKRRIPPAAGIFSAPVALSIVAQVFEERGFLDRMENFTSRFGAQFYGLLMSQETIVLEERYWRVPESIDDIPVFMGGKAVKYQIVS